MLTIGPPLLLKAPAATIDPSSHDVKQKYGVDKRVELRAPRASFVR
jgi:hypothetical protein